VSRLLDFGVGLLLGGGLLLAVTGNPAFAQTPAGTIIRNSARIEFTRDTGAVDQIFSNETIATVSAAPSRSTIAILRAADAPNTGTASTAGPTQCRAGGNFVALPAPRLSNGTTINPLQPVALSGAQLVHGGEAVFIQLTDQDRNRDGASIETVDVQLSSHAGDLEIIRLSETGANAGVFVGYIQSSAAAAVQNDCVLQVERNADIGTLYVDPNDSQDTSSATALVDPYGIVFDSQTGLPVDGARVRLVNAASGSPATVFGDDGVSVYPSEMTTGQQVTDAGGTTYTLPAGTFRFPLVAAGQYRLVVDPPISHAFPSGRAIPEIEASLGNGFRLNSGSYGGAFTVSGPVAVAVDVPVDLLGTGLFLRKTTTTTIAAPGDFVQYTVTAQNTSTAGALQNVRVTDRLPAGMRYRANSSRIGGAVAVDPNIGPDGQTLAFELGNLAANQSLSLSYVAEITVQARGQQLTNSAQAQALNGLRSNPAQATIRLREELFRDAAVIMGRVVTGACDKNSNELPGVAGVRVYLEDGRYAVTDEEGKYHFEGVQPGSHVVQMDAVSIPAQYETQSCKHRVRNAGRGYSQFADVRGGALWRADFWLAKRLPPSGTARLHLRSTLQADLDAQHAVTFAATGVDVTNANMMVVIPSGMSFVPGSAKVDGAVIADPAISDDLLMYKLGAVKAGAQRVLIFSTRAAEEAAGSLATKAVAVFDTPSAKSQRTEPVETRMTRGAVTLEKASYRFSPQFETLKTELNARDRSQLDKLIKEWTGVRNLRVIAVGHTDKMPISNANRVYSDNYMLSRVRAQVVADYIAAAFNLRGDQIQVEGRGPDEPIASGADVASLARNRRVEIEISGTRVTAAGKLSVALPQAESPIVATQGILAGMPTSEKTSSTVVLAAARTNVEEIAVEKLQPGIAWLAPAEGDLQAISSIKVAIQHHGNHTVELRLNDLPVSALNFDGMTSNATKTIAVSRWRGIDIKDGDNVLVAIVRDADNHEVQRMERKVRFASTAVRAELVKEESVLTADGATKPVLVLRLFDAAGKPARPGTQGAFSVDAPYRSWWEVESLRENQITSIGPREPLFQVDDDGLARLELEPTTQSGSVQLRLRFSERQTQELRAWLAPQARDWILVGLAEGTAAHRSISGNLEAATTADLEDGYSDSGRVAFFAKGRIKGDFLLTLAYDSAREKKVDERRLLQTIEPNRYYTVYGDNSEQRFEAPSSSKLYVKVERQQFMALFGDYDTGLTVTELGRYSRTLTGMRSDYAGERFGYTVFGASTDQGLVTDELRGDGTSGLYRLSGGNIVINSDKLRIEVRDRFRTEVVVESRILTRYIDYTIDYLGGTVFFKQPVPSRDGDFNPVFIIADYEVLQGGKEQVTAGGRASYKFGARTEVGATFVQEGAAAGDTQVAASDMRVQITDGTQFRAELARSESESTLRAAEADSYLTEVKHVSERVEASAYFRQQDGGFGFGQQLSTEAGTRKLGIDGRLKISELWSVNAEAQQQSLLDSAAERELASAEVRRHADSTTLGVGLRHVSDSGLPNGDATSDQAFANGSIGLFKDRLTLSAGQDVSLNGASESTDYPSRSVIGADYKLTADTAIFAEYEHAEGAQFDSDMTRIGFRASPWARTRITSSANHQFTEYGARTFANYGLTQGWQINDRWAMDFGVDQSRTIAGNDSVAANGVTPFNRNAPMASGTTLISALNEDFLAASIAAMYRSELWTMTARAEHRDSDSEQRWTWISGFYREPVRGHAFSMATQYMSSDRGSLGDSTMADLRLAWAYRPSDSRFIVLDRLDIKYDTRSDSMLEYKASRYVNNLNVNWQMDPRTQLGLQLGGRYVVSSFDGERYSGISTLVGFDVRRELSQRFDIGLHGTRLDSWSSNVSDTAVGFDVGFTVARNMWISVGYNHMGFDDGDFAASRYTAQGVFVKFRIKADQDTFKDLNLSALRPNRN
jgi:uncharacterized repeat protein (TIGR01451 family)